MQDTNSSTVQDIWSRWLLERRCGGNEEAMRQALEKSLYPWRDRVLQRAALADGETLLDVGSGDGLIAFGALNQNPTCRVIFSDISQALLDHAQALAQEMGVEARTEFINCSADMLKGIPDEHVDVVTTRSVLIYVEDKGAAFRAFHRVLRPGGRISLFEPINNYFLNDRSNEYFGYDVAPVADLAERVIAVYRQVQPPETDPMTTFDEKDLLRLAEEAGFREIRLELQVEIVPTTEWRNWDDLYRTAPNPKAPTIEEAVREALNEEEAQRFISHLRPLVELPEGEERGVHRRALAFLAATK